MEIIAVEAGPIATIGYLVYDKSSARAVIIDTPLESSTHFFSLLKEKKLKLQAVLLTHSHWDHVGDCAKIIKSTGTPVFIHELDEYRLKNPNNHSIVPLPFKIEPATNIKHLNDRDVLKFGPIELEVIHTPGHTEGGVCFVEKNYKVVFAGDTIFRESCGRVDLPGGSMELISRSINELIMSLPDDFTIYSGHGPATTVGHEKTNNPFVN